MTAGRPSSCRRSSRASTGCVTRPVIPGTRRSRPSSDLLVAEPRTTRIAHPLMLVKERSSVPVGGSIRLLVHSGLARQQMVLEVLRGGDRIERRQLSSAAGLQIVEIPVTEEHRGGLGLRLTALRDHQLLQLTDSVLVPWEDRQLHLSFATFRDRLRPGERETWRVTVRGAGEEVLAGGAAELLAYMYDRSLDLFASHQPPQVANLYPVRGAPGAVQASLGAGREIWSRQHGWRELPDYPGLRGDRLVFFSGYGIGGPGMRVGASGDDADGDDGRATGGRRPDGGDGGRRGRAGAAGHRPGGRRSLRHRHPAASPASRRPSCAPTSRRPPSGSRIWCWARTARWRSSSRCPTRSPSGRSGCTP